MTKPTAMVFTSTLTDRSMRETGKTTSNMERVMRHGLMEVNSTVSTSIQRKKARVSILGLMETSISESGRTTLSADTVSISGAMEESMQVNGSRT